jgi:ADP-ribosylation factor GTPase-activating protein 2/3
MKEGPNVSAALSAPVADTGVRKSTIGQRKPASKLGAKKGGLGAQKVKADFSEIEKEAHLLDQMKEKREEDAKLDAERRAQDQEKQMATMRLAYQDLSKQQRQREEQLKHMDPKKAEQVERLGMGLGVRAGVSHSAISDMQTFEQDTPAYGSSKHNLHRKTDSFFDDFEIVESSSSGLGSMGGFSSKKNNSEWDFERPARSKPVDEDIINNRPRPSSYKASSSNSGAGDEAQKKFGNAKAISSDQFFGGSKDMESERRSNLSRFDGQTSISSADYFGDGAQRNMQQQSGFQNSLQNVDLDDVKESVRQGVTKVAGKLSNLANGMMSSIQEKYGY